MPEPQAGGSVAPPAAAPDPALVAAAAMVFVADLAAPRLDADTAHHLIDVLRLRPGELVVAADGSGSWVPCRVASAATETDARHRDPSAILEPDGSVRVTPEARPRLTVAFAPVKGDRPELVVQKLTELGVDRIVPITTRRSVVRWEGERATRALERLSRVAREASAQCRRTRLPQIGPVSSLGALASLAGDPPSLAHPGGAPPSLDHPVIAIGPEGGWDDRELEEALPTVGLGPTVLRAETAAIVAGTLLSSLRSVLIAPCATTLRGRN
ncbi:MAG TPA: RsmE family RNA methyltransferase [Acidimicrobiales bacterium]|jgi:16S rRNA (uracil1498-N3)-methyltransferase|nr:RsmE family RNA methyltransferase [Acidimicrobiales bacterium]